MLGTTDIFLSFKLPKLAKGKNSSSSLTKLPKSDLNVTCCFLNFFNFPFISSNAKSVALPPSITFCINESPTCPDAFVFNLVTFIICCMSSYLIVCNDFCKSTLPNVSAIESIWSAAIDVVHSCSPTLSTNCTFNGLFLNRPFVFIEANNIGCVNTFGPPYIAIRTASSGGTRNVSANLNIHDGFNARCIM